MRKPISGLRTSGLSRRKLIPASFAKEISLKRNDNRCFNPDSSLSRSKDGVNNFIISREVETIKRISACYDSFVRNAIKMYTILKEW